ncbi:MAG: hypothetical protein J0H64_10025, partial [Actinobacteria bacterium]|nr:hypothetical protein [Actinomycetota bacterium]
MKVSIRSVVVGAAGVAACALLVSGVLHGVPDVKKPEAVSTSDVNFGADFSAHPNLPRNARGGLDLSHVEIA